MDSTQAQTQAQYQTAYLEAIRWHQQAFRHMINFITLVVRMIIITALGVVQSRYLKQPWHTSILTGHMWVLELLGGHPERICTALGCNHHTFYYCWASCFRSYQFKVCDTGRAACYLSLLLCHGLNNQACWRTVSKVKWYCFTVSTLILI